MSNFPWRQRLLVDAAVVAYTARRDECAAVRVSYQQWVDVRRDEERSAFSNYRSALDREEHAARRYERLMRRAARLGETGIGLQLARIEGDDVSSQA